MGRVAGGDWWERYAAGAMERALQVRLDYSSGLEDGRRKKRAWRFVSRADFTALNSDDTVWSEGRFLFAVSSASSPDA